MHRTVLLLCLLFAVAFGCNCDVFPSTPKEKFCRSNFVGALSIISKTGHTGDFPFVVYEARSLGKKTIFKSPIDLHGESLTISILTQKDLEIDPWTCGVNWLEEGKTYLLNGNVYHDELYINSCFEIDAQNEWDHVPAGIKNSLRDRSYGKNCSTSLF
ncbi:hypothetical protein QR680_006629 [Steinernema hermaphroditum]|uniref:NTR domain-containing protein n=1 Tax=Steinernema hermaphroditum TaxID=289476 RepID=A0AA39HW11_9BILA|nr:hypothetical protein QR680_006629 [Steinernema hermaphroditum]